MRRHLCATPRLAPGTRIARLLRAFWTQFEFVLGSLSGLFLCFQVLLSFVPTIFHFLYFLAVPAGGRNLGSLAPGRFPSSGSVAAVSDRRSWILKEFRRSESAATDPLPISGARLRQCVHKLNTIIGYNIFVNLSSKRQVVVEFDGAAASLARQSAASAKSAKKAREEFFAQPGQPMPARLTPTKCRQAARVWRDRAVPPLPQKPGFLTQVTSGILLYVEVSPQIGSELPTFRPQPPGSIPACRPLHVKVKRLLS